MLISDHGDQMATIIGHSFLIEKRRPAKSTAGTLLCVILLDT
jgi:hypothetical protein